MLVHNENCVQLSWVAARRVPVPCILNLVFISQIYKVFYLSFIIATEIFNFAINAFRQVWTVSFNIHNMKILIYILGQFWIFVDIFNSSCLEINQFFFF